MNVSKQEIIKVIQILKKMAKSSMSIQSPGGVQEMELNS